MIRVMIVDDQRILLEGLLHLFEKTGKIEVVKILQLSEVAEVAAQVLQPDIILMDICMEGRTSGIEVTRRIKKALPRQKIIIMTGFADVHFVEMAARQAQTASSTKKAAPPTSWTPWNAPLKESTSSPT